MNKPIKHASSSPMIKNLFKIIVIIWLGAIGASLAWNVKHQKQDIYDIALIQARIIHEKDIVYRQWNAGHGGVYVPVTEETQPNPYLEDTVPERDITTPSGKLLTLMNPAHMTRQVFEQTGIKTGVGAHITSLKPLRPENSPDPWEKNRFRILRKVLLKSIQSKR